MGVTRRTRRPTLPFLREWQRTDEAVRWTFGTEGRDWAALAFAVRMGLARPWLRMAGRWRCLQCGAALRHRIEEHTCAAELGR